MNFEKTLNDTDLRALTVAASALVADSCMSAGVLTDEEYKAAKALSARLEAETNLRSEQPKSIAASAPVPLAHVERGSIWEGRLNGGERTGCMWPVPEGLAECSFCAGGPMWAPDKDPVRVLASGLSTEACDCQG